MRPLSYSDRYWFVKMTIGLIILAGVVIGALFLIKGCQQEPHTHTESDRWIISKAADCTNEGVRYKICTGCGVQMTYEVIPAKGHTPGVEKTENKKNSTCTAEGSFDAVRYCTACNVELSREEKVIEKQAHKGGTPVSENRVEPTCTKYGSYEEVVYCSTCPSNNRYEISRVEKIIVENGHEYAWTMFYNEDTHIVNLKGVCTLNCGEEYEEHIFTPDNSGLVVTRDESYAVCCKWSYTLTITYGGEDLEFTYEHPVDSHKVVAYDSTYPDGEPKIAYIPISDYAVTKVYIDPVNGQERDIVCYDYNGTDANGNHILSNYVMVREDLGGWDDFGFCEGVFICVACEDAECAQCYDHEHGAAAYIYIMLYNANYDTRL